jgi:Phycobilisome protein
MITLLEALVDGADGTYAEPQDLRKLEHVMLSWNERKEVYLAVQDKEQIIINRAIESLSSSQLFTAHDMGEKGLECCRRDMTLALRAYALAMLLQDEEMLKDRFINWQKNILQSMELAQFQGVKYVFESICIELSKEQANLLKPYFKIAQDMIMSN